MTLSKLSSKAFSTHAILNILIFVLFIPLLGLTEKNMVVKMLITIFLITIYWFFMYAQIREIGDKDCDRDAYNPKKAAVAGIIVQIPAIILYLFSLLFSDIQIGTIIEAVLRLTLAPYMNIFVMLESLMPHITLFFIAIFPLGLFLSYIDGKRTYKKTLDLIARTEKERAIKSRTDYEG